MWHFSGNRADRPRRIRQLVCELCGDAYARSFFEQFKAGYITEKDIAQIAGEGYNSVRIPFTYSVLMEEGPGIAFKESGFALLDRCLDLCEKYGLYAFLDMHGAPGGQTGANIDDCVDDVPRLFLDQDSWEKALALWESLALRYRDRWIVGGYDLLNEPLHTKSWDGLMPDVDFLIPALRRFYEDCIKRIRRVDSNHLLSLEGPHWSTDIGIFDQEYDPNMCVHFHRYWNAPSPSLLEAYTKLREQNRLPLWLGETGENSLAWYASMFPLLEEHDISWNFWPWKKMDCTNSPCSIRKPKGWERIQAYLAGGPHPGFSCAQAIFDEYLYNMRFENAQYHPKVVSAMLRRGSVTVPAIQRDTAGSLGGRLMSKPVSLPEKSASPGNPQETRSDHPWAVYGLQLRKGERAAYTIHLSGTPTLVSLRLLNLSEDTLIRVSGPDSEAELVLFKEAGFQTYFALALPAGRGEACPVAICCLAGRALMDEVVFQSEC